MSLEDAYLGKAKVTESDYAMEEDVQPQVYWVPETPEKPQDVFVERQLLNSPNASGAVPLNSSLDENKGLCDLNAALATKDEEHNSTGMERMDLSFMGLIDLNKSAYEEVVGCGDCCLEEALPYEQVIENTCGYAGGVAKGSDVLHSRESNKGPDVWDAPFANILSTEILMLLNVAPPASQSSDYEVMQPVIERMPNSSVLVSQSDSGRHAQEPATHTSSLPEHDLLPGLSVQNNTNSLETHVPRFGSQPINGSDSTFSTQSQNQDVNERPQKRPKRKKYWPKVVREGKPKGTPKPKMPVPSTPKCTSSEKNMLGKRKYVRKSSLKNSVSSSDVMVITSEDVVGEGTPKVKTPEPATSPLEKDMSGKRKYVRKCNLKNSVTYSENAMCSTSLDMVAKNMFCENKPKRTPKPETPKQSSEKKMMGKRKYVRKRSVNNLVITSDNVVGEKNYSVIKTCKRALSFDLENQSQDDSVMARDPSQLQIQSSCGLSSSFDLENHSTEESTITLLASQNQVQNCSGKIDSAVLVQECRNHRELVTPEVEKPVLEYCNQAINHIGCQYNDMSVHKRKFLEGACYIYSRKLGPVFPQKKKRSRRKRRIEMSSVFWSEFLANYVTQMQPMTIINDRSFKCEEALSQVKVKTTKRRNNMCIPRRNLADLIIRPCKQNSCKSKIKTKKKSKGHTRRRRNSDKLTAKPVNNHYQLPKQKMLGRERQEQETEISHEPETCNDGSLFGDALFDGNHERAVTWTGIGPSLVEEAIWTSANPQEHEDFQLNSKSRGTHETLIPFEEQEKIAHSSNSRHSTVPTKDAYDQEMSVMAMCLEKGPFPVNSELNINKSEKSPLEHEHFLLTTKSKVDAGLQEERSDAHVSEPVCISDGQALILVQDQNAHGHNSRHDTLVPYQEQDHNAHDPTSMDGTIVPYQGPFEPTKKRKQVAKVDLDPETMRVWMQLMDKSSEGETKPDEEKEKWWDEQRSVFRGRVDSFVARMHQIQGNRRFTEWKGSVMDSVVGVFLTQNVSDHLSSSAFISLASKFPFSDHKTSYEYQQKVDKQESIGPAFDSEGNELLDSKSELDMSYGLDNGAEILAAKAEGANLEGTQDRGPVKDADAPHKSEDSFRVQTTDEIQFSHTPFSMGSSKAFTEPLQSEKTTLLQKSGSNKSNILSSNENPENEYTEPRGMEYGNRNLCSDRINDLTLNHGACAFELSPFPSNVEVDHLKISEDCKTRFVDQMSNKPTLVEDSCPEFVVQQKMPSKTQEVAEVLTYTSGKPFLPPGCNSQAECGIEEGPHTKNCHEGGRTNFQAENIPADELQSLVNEMVESHKGKMQPTSDANTLNKKKGKGKSKNLKKQKTSSGMASDETKKTTRRKKVEKKEEIDWDELRRIYSTAEPRSSDRMDSVDWEAVRCAENIEIAHAIKDRGQQNIIAGRIKDFLNKVVTLHKSIDLEWLRNVPPDLAKRYLLEVNGLGLKSVECVRLLALQNIAFPVDTNVGRIAVRLGWVPLEPLPEELQIHLLEQYPLMDSIQKYLWPRLCNLDQPTLYELHYQLITFGKVFCTKRKPNCIACPMKGECRHFASAYASARLALPAPTEKSIVSSIVPSTVQNPNLVFNPTSLYLLEPNPLQGSENHTNNCEPIIEEPASPEREYIDLPERDIEDFFPDDPDDIPTIDLSVKKFTAYQNLDENKLMLQDDTMSRALVALPAEAAYIRMPKLKYISRLRTEHQVYVLPDYHPLLTGLDKREYDDPCPYLLSIWTPGETANSFEPPKKICNSEYGELCNEKACFSCNGIREQNSNTIRGTILIPCRTAMRGSFPLNGTYFQVNEVFADDESSQNPIDVPRKLIWDLERRTAYFATSASTIFRGLTMDEIQTCFIKGFICVRGFNRKTRAPRPLAKRFHRSASTIGKSRKEE